MKYLELAVLAAVLLCCFAQQERRRVKVRATGAPSMVMRGEGEGESIIHPIRLAAIDGLYDGKLGGPAAARSLCNEKAFHAKSSKEWRNGNWRAVLTTRLQSLWSLVQYQHERENSTILNLRNDTLWSSWNDFVDGKVSDNVRSSGMTQIYTFNGRDLLEIFENENVTEKFAWLGYTPDTEFSDSRTIDANSPHCDNWMDNKNVGPALNLESFMATGSIGGDSVELKPCSNRFAVLCVEKSASWEGSSTYSLYGKDVGGKRNRAMHPNARKLKKLRHGTTPVMDRRRSRSTTAARAF